MAAFIDFVLNQLPPPPCRVLEVGCGEEGGVVAALVEAGYDAVGVDPVAPQGERFARGRFQELEPDGYGVVVAARVLHHVHPLGEGLDRLAALGPALVVDEFAWDLIDEAAEEWYEAEHRRLAAAGAEPSAPATLAEWRESHRGLHPHGPLLEALRARYRESALEWVPYLHRWLGDPAAEARERELTDSGAFPAIGWRWAGARHPGRSNG